MFSEWLVVLFVAYYVDQVILAGSGIGRSPLFFLDRFKKKRLSSSPSLRKPSLDTQRSKVLIQMDKPDVAQKMIGLIKPRSDAAYVQGLDVRSDMNEIYNNMSVCPQNEQWKTF